MYLWIVPLIICFLENYITFCIWFYPLVTSVFFIFFIDDLLVLTAICFFSLCCVLTKSISPWYKRPGWLGVQSQLSILASKANYLFICDIHFRRRLHETSSAKYDGGNISSQGKVPGERHPVSPLPVRRRSHVSRHSPNKAMVACHTFSEKIFVLCKDLLTNN